MNQKTHLPWILALLLGTLIGWTANQNTRPAIAGEQAHLLIIRQGRNLYAINAHQPQPQAKQIWPIKLSKNVTDLSQAEIKLSQLVE